MIRYMLTQDMRQFSVIYLIFIYAFSQGLYKKYRDIFFKLIRSEVVLMLFSFSFQTI